MSNERIHYLNGLRGVLAVTVFIHHFFYLFAPDFIFGGTYEEVIAGQWKIPRIIAYSPLNILYNPGAAINFFFLLSGYVQSFHYFKTGDVKFVQKSFIKRYFRLAIPTLSAVLLIFIFQRLQFFNKHYFPVYDINAEWIKSMLPDNLNLYEVFKHGLVTCFNENSRYYQILWTMPIELYSSLMVMIILLVTDKVENKLPLLIFWVVVQAFVLQAFYSVSFTLGVLFCYLDVTSDRFRAIFHVKF